MDAAIAGANLIWDPFGAVNSNSSTPRPFGDAVVGGFDFDIESMVDNMPVFGTQLRSLMVADPTKSYFLTTAPQRPYPDATDGAMLDGAVDFDAIWVQFYNNYCGLQSFTDTDTSRAQTSFNFDVWDGWAHNVSKNPNVRVFLGVPANTGAAGSGYESSSTLSCIISYRQNFSSFGGVMMWDSSHAYANSGFISAVASALTGSTSSLTHSFVPSSNCW